MVTLAVTAPRTLDPNPNFSLPPVLTYTVVAIAGLAGTAPKFRVRVRLRFRRVVLGFGLDVGLMIGLGLGVRG